MGEGTDFLVELRKARTKLGRIEASKSDQNSVPFSHAIPFKAKNRIGFRAHP